MPDLEREPALVQRLPDHGNQLAGLKRYLDKVVGAILHGLNGRPHVTMPGHEDHREIRILLHQLAQEDCAVHAWQTDVGQDNETAIARQHGAHLFGTS